MQFEYEETSQDLQTRIDIHNKYGGKDIDAWMLSLLKPAPGSKVLDVGCGAGKQLLAFHDYLNGDTELTGGDVNPELLEEARGRTRGMDAIEIMELDFNRQFPMKSGRFDLVSCCFAIYYAADIPFTIKEMHRVLRSGGRLFTTGPMRTNKREFYDVIREATGKEIPPMPGSSRYDSEILGSMREVFSAVEVDVFENPLRFKTAEPFVAYARASLSEDRKLWGGFFESHDEFNEIMAGIQKIAERRVSEDGELVMTKVVGGFVAVK